VGKSLLGELLKLPIIHNKRPVDIKDVRELNEKRARRNALRHKYTLIRKDQKPEDFKKIRLIVGDEEYDISDSSKFLLDHLISGAIKKQEI
jgi:hypothetical protein